MTTNTSINKGGGRIILDLCGGTGSWSKPYKDSGYEVYIITLPQYDVGKWLMSGDYLRFVAQDGGKDIVVDMRKVYGILAAPPRTMFSHARTTAKNPRDLKVAMDIVRACLDVIAIVQYKTPTGAKITPLKFWALENPHKGLLPKFIGKPAYVFEPWEFGDPYTKQTALWGYFNDPKPTHSDKPPTVKFDRLKTKEIHPEYYGKYTRTERRAITPQGFAKAFMEANP